MAFNLWPPPTQGMLIDQLLELKRAATGLLSHLETVIPEECSRGGHSWEKAVHDYVEVRKYTTVEGEGPWDSYRSYAGEENQLVFRRTCGKCGKVESRRPVVTSCDPFAAQERPQP